MAGQSQWSFLELPRGAKARDPMQDEFFQDQSIDGIEHALIRETVQNSLDARLGNEPVRMVFSLGRLAANRAEFWFPEGVQAHFSAKEIRLTSLPDWGVDDCPYLTIEDFGTKGLEGQIDAADPQAGGNFYHFFRAEGISNKKDGDRGSWGVGKIVIPRSSRVRSFFAVTRRASVPGMHLMGQAILRHHEIQGRRYTPDGWFSGDRDGLQIPFTSDAITERLKVDFRLGRVDEPGLGLVIPWIYEEQLTLEKLAAVIAREYFIPILAGDLIVELRDHSRDSFRRLDSNGFSELKLAAGDDDQFQDILQLAGSLLGLEHAKPLSIGVVDGAAKGGLNYDWTTYGTDVPSEDIEAALEVGRVAHFRVPMTITAKGEIPASSHFDVLMKKKPGRHFPVYIRDGLIIPNQPTRKKTSDCVVLIYVAGNAIADALRRAECPAHTDWKASRDKFREQQYGSANRLIPFVRDSAIWLLDMMSSDDGKPDHGLLADLLPMPSDESTPKLAKGNGLGDREKDRNEAVKPRVPEIKPSFPRCWRLRQAAGKVHLSGDPAGFTNEKGYRLSVRVAYDIQGRNPFKAHSKYDFDLRRAAEKGIDDYSRFRVVANEAVQIESGDAGSLVILVASPEFELIFEPDDLNRDLIVKVASAAVGASVEEMEVAE